MVKKMEVKKIVIDIGKDKIELSPDNARELRDLLDDLLGKKETVYIPGAPIIVESPRIWKGPYQPYERWEITCDSDSSSDGTVTYSMPGI